MVKMTMFELVRRIKQIVFSKILARRKFCIISPKANIDFNNVCFEGYNRVGDRTSLRNCSVGLCSYIADRSNLYNVKIGRFTAISSYVHLAVGRHPSNTFVSVHPSFFSDNPYSGPALVSNNKFDEIKYADKDSEILVSIGNDVWIGQDVTILDGVTIADGTIVAAGAVVTKDTQPYSVVGGVPAKLIKYRFEEDEISKLLDLKWWDKDISWIKERAELFEDINIWVKNMESL